MSVNVPIRNPGTRYVPLATVLVAAGAAVWAALAGPASARSFVLVFGLIAAILLGVATTLAVRSGAAARQARGDLAEDRLAMRRLADETLPELVDRLRAGTSADTAIAGIPPSTEQSHRDLLRVVAREIGAGERMRSAAMSACANAAGRVQALATAMLADLREMEQRHGEEVLGDLLRIDHATAQAGRLADSIAVLTGARSGRRWTKPIVMESVLRGAVGRISAYQRVRLHSASTLAVAGYAAEGVMHALAELMDNATNFSPPSEPVHVYVEEVPAGMVVTIEDGGLVMGEYALRRAEQSVSAEQLDLATLSGTRLGLAVVGCLARKYGLTVSFRPSSRGGTGVVVMIPRRLLTEPRPDAITARTRRPDSLAGAAKEPAMARSGSGGEPSDSETGGLPRRRRGQTLAAATARSAPSATEPPAGSRPEGGARFGAFRAATRGVSSQAGPVPTDAAADEEDTAG